MIQGVLPLDLQQGRAITPLTIGTTMETRSPISISWEKRVEKEEDLSKTEEVQSEIKAK